MTHHTDHDTDLDIPQQRQHGPELQDPEQVRGRERAIARMRADAAALGIVSREVHALRIDTAGRVSELVYRGREHHALREPLEIRAEDAPGGVGIRTLDEDLTMWFDEYGAEHQPVNPVASVVARAFGRGEQVFGPVVVTGWTDTGGVLGGRVADISAAATVLLAGMAASCDPPAVTTGRDRAGEWTGLGVYIEASGGPESFDALAWTITRDGDVPRCVECDEPGSHPEHQPEVLAEQHDSVGVGGH